MNTPKKLFNNVVSTNIETLYTVPTGKVTIVKNIILSNTTENMSTITIHLVNNGEFPANANKFIPDYQVNPKDVVVIDISAVLEEGDTIQGMQITEGAVNAYISGVEVE